MVDRTAFKDFVICKALDVISGNGTYRKYLHQCCENGEAWAQRVSGSVAAMNTAIKELHATVDRVRRLSNSKVGKACSEIIFSIHAPVRVIPGWSTCFITECQAQNCVDLSRATKQNQTLPVHPKFAYFVLMLFYTHSIEHVTPSCGSRRSRPRRTWASSPPGFRTRASSSTRCTIGFPRGTPTSRPRSRRICVRGDCCLLKA